jgi:hypothetical protein
MHASTAALLLGLPASLAACYLVARWSRSAAARLYVARCTRSLSLADEENQVLYRGGAAPAAYGALAVAACGVLLFLCASFAHEWVQESLQIYGEQQTLLLTGPPSSCEPEPHRGLVDWITSKSDADRARECQRYYDAVYRLPLANPLSALVTLCAGLVIQPCLLFYRHFIRDESYATQSIFCGAAIFLVHICLTHLGRVYDRYTSTSAHAAGAEPGRHRRAPQRSFEPRRRARAVSPQRALGAGGRSEAVALWTFPARGGGKGDGQL